MAEKKETRAGKYGRNLALFVSYALCRLPASENYKREFLEELQTYSLKPRRKGTPPGRDCESELREIYELDISNPKQFARLIKEGIHLMYQKNTAKNVLTSLLENL